MKLPQQKYKSGQLIFFCNNYVVKKKLFVIKQEPYDYFLYDLEEKKTYHLDSSFVDSHSYLLDKRFIKDYNFLLDKKTKIVIM